MHQSTEDICQKLQELFDSLAKDMSLEEYKEACEEVAVAFQTRADSAQEDIERKEKGR